LLPTGFLDLENVNYISEQDYEKINRRSRVDVGDILFGMIGTIGNPVMIQGERTQQTEAAPSSIMKLWRTMSAISNATHIT
jgi:hypothetical protein